MDTGKLVILKFVAWVRVHSSPFDPGVLRKGKFHRKTGPRLDCCKIVRAKRSKFRLGGVRAGGSPINSGPAKRHVGMDAPDARRRHLLWKFSVVSEKIRFQDEIVMRLNHLPPPWLQRR